MRADDEPAGGRSGRRLRAIAFALAALLIVAGHLALRVRGAAAFSSAPGASSAPLDVPLFASSDSYYHAHRVRLLYESFPRLVYHDRFMFHPAGTKAEWPLGFDAALAATLRAAAPFAGGWSGVVGALPYASVALSVVALGLFFALSRRHLTPALALAATGCLSANLAFVRVSSVGELDHHVQEVTAVVLLLLVPGLVAQARARGAVFAGVALAWLCWNTTLLAYLVVGFLVVWLGVLLARDARQRPRQLTAFSFALGGPLAAFAAVESAARGAPLGLATLSLVHAGAAAAALGALHLVGRLPRAQLAAALLTPAALVLAAAPGGAAWVGRLVLGADPFLAHVTEAKPLLVGRDGPTLFHLHAYFGWLYLAFPLAFFVLRRRGEAALPAASLWLSLALFIVAFSQKRFAHLFAPALVLGLFAAAAALRGRARPLAALAVVALLVEPAARLGPRFAPALSEATRDAVAAARLLRAETAGRPGADRLGVAAPPNFGNAINWVARLPAVTNTFFYPRYLRFDLDLRTHESDEALVAQLRAQRIGHLVAADDVRYRVMLLELFGRAAEAEAEADVGPCSPVHLRRAFYRLACLDAPPPAGLERLATLERSSSPSRLMRRVVIYKVTP